MLVLMNLDASMNITLKTRALKGECKKIRDLPLDLEDVICINDESNTIRVTAH